MEKRKEGLRNKRICRFCLKDDEPLTSIFDRSIRTKNSAPLALQIMACVSIEVFPSDGMPGTICQLCRYFMDQSYRFKQICRQGDEALRHYIVHGDLRTPIGWPQDMIKHVPEELLASVTVQVATEEEVTEEEEEEIDVPFDVSEMEKIQTTAPSKRKNPSKKTVKKEPKDVKTSVESSSFLLEDEEQDVKLEHSTVAYPESEDSPQGAFPCTQCHHSFPLKQLLELHQKSHQRKRNHICPLCSKPFCTKYDLQCHIVTHSGTKPYECVICQKKFARLSLLRRHEKTHRTVTKYLCSECNSVFLSAAILQEHILRKHNTDRPFKCQHCDKCFAFKQGLERHSVSHGTHLPHKCNYCPQSFVAANMLQRHVLQKHAGNRPYLCKFCPKSFLLSHHYTRHLKSKHMGQVVEDPVRNRITSKDNASLIKMEQQDQEQFKCVQCETTFEKQDDLIFHSAVHATQDLTCPLCKEIFEDVDEVVVHIKSHIEGEQFVCEWCELVFTSEEKLDEHIDNEHKEAAQEVDITFLEGKVMYKTGADGDYEVPVENMESEQQAAGQGGTEGEEEEEYTEEEELEEEGEEQAESAEPQEGHEDSKLGLAAQQIEGGVVVEWTPVTTSSGSQPSQLQELMVVGGGETIVYQLGNQPITNVSNAPSGVSIELQLPEATPQAVISPKVMTPVKDDSPRPVYAELKTVDHPLYSANVIEDQTSPAKETMPVKQTTPTKAVQAEKPLQETKGLSSILQKAEEVKLQKKRLEELKMKARMQLQMSGATAAKRKVSVDDSKEDESNWEVTEKLTSKKGSDSVTKKQSDAEKPDEIREKFDKKCGKRYVQKMLSFSKKSADDEKNSKETTPSPVKRTSEPPVKKSAEPKQKKVEPAKPETPVRSGEKSLMMLERDIMELKKNASQKTGTPTNNSSSRFIGTKVSRLSLNSSSNNTSISSSKTFSQLKKNDVTNKKTSPQKETDKKKSGSDGTSSKSYTVAFPIPIKPVQESTPIKQDISQKNEVKKTDNASKSSSTSRAAEPTAASSDNLTSPRRSRRASKIKDYAAMIRDNTKVGSDDDEDDEEADVTNSSENVTRASDFAPMDDDSDDDIDINEEVLIHRATPAPKSKLKVPGRKRGRPRKHNMTSDVEPAEQNTVATKRKQPSEDDEDVVVRKDAESVSEETPPKKKRGRPSKSKQDVETPKSDSPPTTSKTVGKQSSSSDAPSGRILMQKVDGGVHVVKQEGQTVLMSPTGQPLKKVPAQLIKSLPPGVKPLPLPSSLGNPVGQVSQMKIGPKTVRVQKILMTKSQLHAMTAQGLVEIKDGAMVLKQGVKLPTNPELLKTTPKTSSESSAGAADTSASQNVTDADESDPLAMQNSSLESEQTEAE